MASHFCIIASKKLERRLSRLGGRKAAVALEFAILAIPFFMWVLFIFELSYDMFTQEALDYAVHAAVRQLQTGSAEGSTDISSGANFIKNDVCTATKGLLECQNIWISVTAIDPPGSAATDYSPSVTTGAIPGGGSLDLSGYTNAAGVTPGGPGQSAAQITPAYCVASASQPVLVSVIYLGPTFIGGLLPGVLSTQYGGATVHATLSTAGFVTEPFPTTNSGGNISTGSTSGGASGTTAPQCTTSSTATTSG